MKFRWVWLMFVGVAIASCATSDQGDEDAGGTGEGGTTGKAGTSGGAGLAGTTGSGVAGTIGTTGAAGTTGPTGAAGKNGVAGTTGAAGTSGEAGTNGAAGTAGGAGRGGTNGGAGTTGAAGTIGIAGRGGVAGTTGAAGTTGSGGAGTPGLGAWTTGYAATMYGNDSSGDCDGYPDFGDTTNIDSQTCTKVVSIASYSAGVANNASYYGATGDLSSLWSGAECSCNGNDTCPSNQAPSCPAESQPGGNCGICVAVKCDPNGTFSLSGATHDQDCDKTHYVVVQIIDACPHDHPTNVASSEGWCTSRQANHVDLSCSALGGISTKGMNIGQDGWLNVDVQKVDCSLGLGLHSL
jgi:hypothetical protein